MQPYQKKPESIAVIIGLGFLAVLFFTIGYETGAIKRVGPKAKAIPIEAQPATKGDIEQLKSLMTSQTAPLQKINAVPRIRLLSQQFPNRGGSWVARIDNYLAKTPLRGQGRTITLAAADAGISVTDIPAIAMIESGGGRANANSFNAFGRKSISGGWVAFASWEDAINNQAWYLRRNYYDQGRTTPELIAAKYAPASDGNVGYAGKLRAEKARI